MKRLRIDIIGTYPPPIGGTSIHLQRLLRANREHGIDAIAYDTHANEQGKEINNEYVRPIKNYKKFILRYFFNKRADIIHAHSHSWVERMILTIKARLCGQKTVFTFHSLRDELSSFSAKQKFAYKYVLKKADAFIATSPNIKEKLVKWGCKPDKISVIPPFIVPSKKDSGVRLGNEIERFKDRFNFIISANASNNDHYNGEDLYGLDMCIELICSLSPDYNVGFIYVLTKTTDESYLDSMKKKIQERGVSDRFFLIEGSLDFISLLKISTIFVRPTNTDSWSLSVSESLSVGVPCIASNACKREEGTIFFKVRDQGDFELKVRECLGNLKEEKEKLQAIKISDYYENIFDVYVKLCNAK